MRIVAARRRAALAVESAIVYTVMFLMILGLLVGGLGIFRYQQVAWLSQEGARRTCVRGADFQLETMQTPPTQAQIRDELVALTAGLDPAALTVEVWLVDGLTGQATAWDSSSKSVLATAPSGEKATNRLRVVVRYQWIPETGISGPILLGCNSEVPMAF
jgi:hypothetical protein